jgi:hypothetical protein
VYGILDVLIQVEVGLLVGAGSIGGGWTGLLFFGVGGDQVMPKWEKMVTMLDSQKRRTRKRRTMQRRGGL